MWWVLLHPSRKYDNEDFDSFEQRTNANDFDSGLQVYNKEGTELAVITNLAGNTSQSQFDQILRRYFSANELDRLLDMPSECQVVPDSEWQEAMDLDICHYTLKEYISQLKQWLNKN